MRHAAFSFNIYLDRGLMSDAQLSTAVNQHYLSKVMELSDSMDVQANEDIFDARGNKLLAKGARVSRALQEKLIVHKLTKPLEACIAVDGGVDDQRIAFLAERLLDGDGPMARVIKRSGSTGKAPAALLSSLKFGSAMSMMLTIADKDNGAALNHAVTVSLLSIAIGRKAGVSELDQRVAGMAGLLHDVGELYIDPTYLTPGKRLLPHEWSHLVVHPHTGQMLINELDKFPPAVGRAVSEHHERFDGGGYPRRLQGNAISVPGQLVSLAEMVSGVFARPRAVERIALALKIIPGEHAKSILDALNGSLSGDAADIGQLPFVPSPCEDVTRLVRRITLATIQTKSVLNGTLSKSPRVRDLLVATLSRLSMVERAVISTGLDMFITLQVTDSVEDAPLMFEKEVATRELQWRLRDIARDLALQVTESERLLFTPIIQVLDDDFSTAHYSVEPTPVEEFS